MDEKKPPLFEVVPIVGIPEDMAFLMPAGLVPRVTMTREEMAKLYGEAKGAADDGRVVEIKNLGTEK
jgi:hypothetical protein